MTLLGAGGGQVHFGIGYFNGVSQISVFVRSVSIEKTRPYLDKLQRADRLLKWTCML